MRKEEIFCDICKVKITSTYWDEAPSKVEVKMSAPAQTYENHTFDDVCRNCRTRIGEFLISLANVPIAVEDEAGKGMSNKACEGAETISKRIQCEHMEECQHCGDCTRFDLVDHPFFGFKAFCSVKAEEAIKEGGGR